MAQNYIIDSQYLKDIANAIRKKNKTNQKYTVKEMANAILGLNTPETAEVEDILRLKLYGKMTFNFTDEVSAVVEEAPETGEES